LVFLNLFTSFQHTPFVGAFSHQNQRSAAMGIARAAQAGAALGYPPADNPKNWLEFSPSRR
jgi:hypothetical protein